jgi:enduracididine biosynthesis enzyme MppP
VGRLLFTFAGSPESMADDGNLTQLEYMALNSTLNFADGHARQDLTPRQREIIDELPNLFAEGVKQPVTELERDAFTTYFELLGQHSFPAESGRVLSCYSSSVAIEIAARSLATETNSVALINPTFDNIPDILKRVGMNLVPLPEAQFRDHNLGPHIISSVGGVFITTPNNPTGSVLPESRLQSLARQCVKYNKVLVLDTSFRGFDTRAHYDHYAVLEASGCRWIVIEDTGKLWPTLDLKVGWLVTSANIDLPVGEIYSEILLGISPLVLALVRRFAEDAASGGLSELHRFIAMNRQLLRSELADVPGIEFPDATNRGSVERIHLRDWSGVAAWSALRERNIYVLPCRQFYWANPAEGNNAMRVALARPTSSLATAARAMRSVLLAQ